MVIVSLLVVRVFFFNARFRLEYYITFCTLSTSFIFDNAVLSNLIDGSDQICLKKNMDWMF